MLARLKFSVFLTLLCTVGYAVQCPTVFWLRDRLEVVQSSGVTFASVVESNPALKQTLSRILDHFRFLGAQKNEGVPKSEVVREGVKNPWRCERNEDRLGNAVEEITQNFGWPITKPGRSREICRSIIKSDDADFRRKLNNVGRPSDLFSRITSFMQGVNESAEMVGKSYNLEWDRFERIEEQSFDADRFRRCRVVKALGYRIDGKWSLAARVSNTEVGFEENNYQRETLEEYLNTDGSSTVTSLDIRLPTCANGQLTGFSSGSATVSSWDGEHTWSHFANFPLEDNPAIQDALDKSDFNKELVEDINNPSSFIALWLPTIVVMIPLALFQDWDPRTSVLYRIATDVIAVLPFLSKGLELIINGSKRTYSTVSFVYGAESLSDVAVAETWVAFCEMKPYVMGVGIACLVLIAIQIVIGLILEKRARRLLEIYVSNSQSDLDDEKDNSIPSDKIDQNIAKPDTNFWVARGNGLLWHISQARYENSKQGV